MSEYWNIGKDAGKTQTKKGGNRLNTHKKSTALFLSLSVPPGCEQQGALLKLLE